MKHRWGCASAFLTLIIIEIERLSNVQFDFPESALWTGIISVACFNVFNQVFLAWATPTDRAAVVFLVINWNAAFNYSTGVAQWYSAVDLITVWILFNWSWVRKVFRAETFIAVLVGVNLLTFTICFTFKMTCRQFINLIV